jgi:hypothetical protein
MATIKLINEYSDISSIFDSEGKPKRVYNWDLEVYGKPYYVIKIPEYVHTLDGNGWDNDLWCFPRDEVPSYKNLYEYHGSFGGTRWGYNVSPKHYYSYKYDEYEVYTINEITITRNDKDFCKCKSVFEALSRIEYLESNEHPLELIDIDFDKKCIGRKVWYRGEPAKIDSYVRSEACVIIVPDGIESFTIPPELENFPLNEEEYEKIVKISIFSELIYWYR